MKKVLVLMLIGVLLVSSIGFAGKPSNAGKPSGNGVFYMNNFNKKDISSTNNDFMFLSYNSELTYDKGVMNISVPDDTHSGAFGRLNGYQTEWMGDQSTRLKIYVDPKIEDYGFEVSLALNSVDNGHIQDNIFHVEEHEGIVYVDVDHNTNFDRPLIVNKEDAGMITEAGWYDFEFMIKADEEDSVYVETYVYDSEDNIVFSKILEGKTKDTSLVGGHRYLWFTYVGVEGGLNVKQVKSMYID